MGLRLKWAPNPRYCPEPHRLRRCVSRLALIRPLNAYYSIRRTNREQRHRLASGSAAKRSLRTPTTLFDVSLGCAIGEVCVLLTR